MLDAPAASAEHPGVKQHIEANDPEVKFSSPPSIAEQVGMVIFVLLTAIVAYVFEKRT